MKYQNMIYATMGFLITWTVILCTYSFKMKELDCTQPVFTSSIQNEESTAAKKRSWW